MDYQAFAYDACRRYVSDHHGLLGDTVCRQLQGWLRSRSLLHLTTCSTLIPDALLCRERFRVLRQVEAFFKKNAVYSESAECEAAAIKTFFEGEKQCRITNRRLDYYYAKRERLAPDLSLWWSRAEEYVRLTLGSYRDFLDELPRLCRVTAGATAVRSRKESYPHMKISPRMWCTPGAAPYLSCLAKYFGYERFRPRLVPYNRVEVVPKNWKTGRTIACEPDGNIPLQLAFDVWTKGRLRKRGINLSKQSLNRDLAKEASVTGELATVDLSAASDTISYNCVAALLPGEWLHYLIDVRSPLLSHDNKLHSYAKFSSMGNGATFALETLLFAAACYAVGSQRFSVYGDDIIIERERYDDLVRFMQFLGFTVNTGKSYHSGPFRESCGGDYYEGCDITPFYVRDVKERKSVLCHLVNGLVSISPPDGAVWDMCKELVSAYKLPLVPFNGDSMSGIWIDASTSYSLGLITTRQWKYLHIPMYRAYCTRTPVMYRGGAQNLFLWHLDRYRERDVEGTILKKGYYGGVVISESINDTVIRSAVPAYDHKYVRKWVHWIPPVVGAPVHLYRWAEQITSASAL